MKKIIIILSLLTCIFTPIFSQNFAPIGAKWYYSADDYQPPFNRNYILIESIKDTVVLGRNAKKLTQTNFYGAGGSISSDLGVFYFDSNRVYIYLYNRFNLLYDFNATQGDTIYIVETFPLNCGGNNDTLIQTLIDSVKIENIGGVMRKVQYITNLEFGWLIGEKHIESVGSNHFLIPIDCMAPPSIDSLRCYSDSIINYQLVVDCEELAVGVNEVKDAYINFNTIILDNIFFPTEMNGRFTIYDLNGRIIMNETIKPIINLQNLKSGIYLLILNTKKINKQFKIIKL
jgi:hypothetical protein